MCEYESLWVPVKDFLLIISVHGNGYGWDEERKQVRLGGLCLISEAVVVFSLYAVC